MEIPSREAFITEEPIDIIKSGNYNKVPLIFGYTTGEGMLIAMMTPNNIISSMPKDFESLIPYWLRAEPGTPQSKLIAEKIKNFYYNKPGSENDDQVFYEVRL